MTSQEFQHEDPFIGASKGAKKVITSFLEDIEVSNIDRDPETARRIGDEVKGHLRWAIESSKDYGTERNATNRDLAREILEVSRNPEHPREVRLELRSIGLTIEAISRSRKPRIISV